MKPQTVWVHIWRVVWSAVLLSAVLASCASPEQFSLKVKVEDENGDPVPNVSVVLEFWSGEPELTGVTDSLGNYLFTVDKKHLEKPATIRIFCPGKLKTLHEQTISLKEGLQPVQVNPGLCAPAVPGATTPPIAAAPTSTIASTSTASATVSATFTPSVTSTATSTPTLTPGRTPAQSTATSFKGIVAFTPYPTSAGIINPGTKNEIALLTIWKSDSPVYALAVSPDGKLAASGGQNGKITVRDMATGTPLYMLDYGSAVLAIAFAPNGQWLAAAGNGRNILVWNTSTWSNPLEIGRHNGKVTSLSFSPDGTLLASGGYEDKTVNLWEVNSWKLNTSLSVPEKVNALTFSSDSEWIAVAANDIFPRVWDRNGLFQYLLTANDSPRKPIVALAFSPDSGLLVTGTHDGERCLQVWDTKSRQLRRVIGGNQEMQTVAFSPSGELIVTANEKLHITLWRTSNVSILRTLQDYHLGPISAIVFSPDGKLMLTASHDKTIRVWGIRQQ